MNSSHEREDDRDSETANPNARSAVRVIFGDRALATYATEGAAMAAPLANVPVGARIVAKGLVKAKLQHAVSEKGHVYAGWMICEEKERAAR